MMILDVPKLLEVRRRTRKEPAESREMADVLFRMMPPAYTTADIKLMLPVVECVLDFMQEEQAKRIVAQRVLTDLCDRVLTLEGKKK